MNKTISDDTSNLCQHATPSYHPDSGDSLEFCDRPARHHHDKDDKWYCAKHFKLVVKHYEDGSDSDDYSETDIEGDFEEYGESDDDEPFTR